MIVVLETRCIISRFSAASQEVDEKLRDSGLNLMPYKWANTASA
jgi:hypothetical protein